MSSRFQTVAANSLSPTVSGGISIAFWVALLMALCLFGAVTLAPRLAQWHALNQRFDTNERQIEKLRSDIRQLESTLFALEYDPGYVRHLAAAEFRSGPDANLREINGQVHAAASPVASSTRLASSAAPEPWYLPLAQELSQPGDLRWRLVAGSAGLCLLAFTCLNEEFFSAGLGGWLRAIARWVVSRYQS